jgi:hypothetical protein
MGTAKSFPKAGRKRQQCKKLAVVLLQSAQEAKT